MGEVFVITSGKGGVGKTTSTANIGAGLAAADKKTILIDTDIGLRNLDVIMGLENRIVYHLVDIIEGGCRIKQALIRINVIRICSFFHPRRRETRQVFRRNK